MFDIPTTVTIKGEEFGIRDDGDYRMVLDCCSTLQAIELPKKERLITAIVIFYDGFSLDNVFDILDTQEKMEEAVIKMYEFINCGNKDMGHKSNVKLMDWEQDEQIIASAINKVANTEVRAVEYLHWWTFMGYYIAIDESVFSTVIRIRAKIEEGKKLEKHEQEFRQKNPDYFIWNHMTIEQQENDALARELWNREEG